MSSKPANKAPGSPAASKKKRTGSKKATSSATRKKVSKSTARKKAARTSSPKKKVASRKAQGKKTASRKASGTKTPRKGALLKDTATDTETAADTEAKSISWMSAQATSALKAVKANQAEKGQAVLAKNKKHKERQPIDDASLIEIAEGMPVDDAALIEFAAEDLQQEALRKPAETAQETRADSSDAATVISKQAATPNQAEIPETMSDPETPPAEALPEETITETPAISTPPPPVRQQTTRWSVILAITVVAVTLGYVYWSGDEDGTLMGTITEMYRSQDEPAAAMTAAPAEKETVTADQPEIHPDTASPAVAGDTWKPAHMPPVVTPSAATRSPGPATAAVEQPLPEPAVAAQPVPVPVVEEQPLPEPAVAETLAAEPVVAESPAPEPAVVAQPAPQPATPPAAAPTAAAPTATAPTATTPATAPGGYRSQGYGYYPQSRQPAYPPQYYRQHR